MQSIVFSFLLLYSQECNYLHGHALCMYFPSCTIIGDCHRMRQ